MKGNPVASQLPPLWNLDRGLYGRRLRFPGDHWHLSVGFKHLQRQWGLSQRHLDTQIPPKKQPVSVKTQLEAILQNVLKTYLGKYSLLCNQLPWDNEVSIEKRKPFGGGGRVGTGASPKILAGGPFRTVLFPFHSKSEAIQARNHS